MPLPISGNEAIWWQVFPRIRTSLTSNLIQFFGAAKESPSRDMIGAVVLVADTRRNLRFKYGAVGGSLLNHWGCYCDKTMDEGEAVYMAGTETEPGLIFRVPTESLLSLAILRFSGEIDPSIKDAVQELIQGQTDMLKEAGQGEELRDTEVSIVKYQPGGSWVYGLAIAFRASIWLNSNQEEALANIWNIWV
ncbi:MAG: hypothetical protein JXB43_02635 [Dehalococcoidia bacterium]|nr:hypothetical protein [Dehalococcoidia bacterium]